MLQRSVSAVPSGTSSAALQPNQSRSGIRQTPEAALRSWQSAVPHHFMQKEEEGGVEERAGGSDVREVAAGLGDIPEESKEGSTPPSTIFSTW